MKTQELNRPTTQSRSFEKLMDTKIIQLDVGIYLKKKFTSVDQADEIPPTTLEDYRNLSARVHRVAAFNELRKIHVKSNLVLKHQLKNANVDARIIASIKDDHFALPTELDGLNEDSIIINQSHVTRRK